MRHLITVKDLSLEDVNAIFMLADSFYEQIDSRPIKKVPLLTGKTVALLFSEPSTRTRVSFELAAKRLSADTVTITQSTSSMKKGETLEDTARTLSQYGIDLLVIRHSKAGAPDIISSLGLFPVVNAGDGKRSHPTQALLDAYTIYREYGKIKGLKVAIIGDILHSRVARSNFEILRMFGCRIFVLGPTSMIPSYLPEDVVRLENIEQAIEECDLLYFLRIQFERFNEREVVDIDTYRRKYALTRERFEKIKKRDLRIMHPGPVNRGIEIDSEAVDSEFSLVFKQVKFGLYVRMGILAYLLSERSEEIEVPY
ncbi:MAG: aspartate carbamoyltransferase catalytic subunit [Actinobacteria bacterium]|nr:aspartate carbamoyltransferase catalytic subunit [Actinomycetota bacterium]